MTLPKEAQEFFDTLGEPAQTINLDGAWKVPASVLKELPVDKKTGKPSTRGLGRTIVSRSQGARCIRTVDGEVYAVSTKNNPHLITDKMRRKYGL